MILSPFFSKDGSASRVAAAAAAASLLLLLWVFFVGGDVLPLRPFAAVVGGLRLLLLGE